MREKSQLETMIKSIDIVVSELLARKEILLWCLYTDRPCLSEGFKDGLRIITEKDKSKS